LPQGRARQSNAPVAGHSALAAAVNPAHDAPMPSAGKAARQASLFPV